MEKLKALEDELKVYQIETLSIAADIGDRSRVREAAAQVIEKFRQIDILVCCAGQYYRSPALELQMEDFERIMRVNFYGTLNCIYEVLPFMREKGKGSIATVSSVDGKNGVPLDGSYVASKFALAGFLDVFRQELRGTGIAVSAVFPGRVDTPLIEDLDVPRISAKIPPDRVAKAIIKALRKRNGEIFVPYFTSKSIVILNSISYKLGDLIIRLFKLEGWKKQ